MIKINLLPVLVCFLFSISCKKEVEKTDQEIKTKSTIKYAKGFDIVDENGTKKLIIKAAYQNADAIFEYHIKKKKSKTIADYNYEVIEVPIQKIVVTSTTHIPMVELLNEEKAIVGFP
ncbi:MAG: iron complex transport system substrate-binding protein, partial [Flavobacteriales bacterium]